MEEEKVWIALYHLIDDAHLWYMQLEMEEGTPSWKCFAELINLCFGPPIRSNLLGELAALRRTGSVEEYIRQFSALRCRYPKLDSEQQVQLFTDGLLKPLRTHIELQNPASLQTAMSLARAYEELEGEETTPTPAPKPPARAALVSRAASSTQPALPAPPPRSEAPVKTSTTAAPQRQFKKLSPLEMADRRAKGLCFNCDEKFARGHRCQKLFWLEVCDPEEIDDKETAAPQHIFSLMAHTQGDTVPAVDDDDSLPAEVPTISVRALTWICTGQTMQLMVSVGDAQLKALVDLGSTHNFLSEQAAKCARVQLHSGTHVQVTVANGDRVVSPDMAQGVALDIFG
jgi:hypothetical protein